MVVYTVTAYTGSKPQAGTSNSISIQLQGPEDETPPEDLDEGLFSWGFSAGSVKTFNIHSERVLGELLLVKLYSRPLLGFDNQWFCDKILVTTPKGDEILFPCYRWLASNERLVLRPAKAVLEVQDTNPATHQFRIKQRKARQELFGWNVYAEGVPHVICFDAPGALPDELRFSYAKEFEFYYTAGSQLIALKLNGLANSRKSWTSINKLEAVLCGDRSKTLEYVVNHWDEDEFFGYQYLNGLNPMMIKRCSKLPENFPVTEAMVKGLLGGNTLDGEMKKGKIFLCNYKMLHGLIGNVIHGSQQYLTAPLVLLHCSNEGKMMPIAIQLMQTPGADNPIFLPTDSERDWLLAKIFVRAAEFSVHEVDFHLLRTHLLAEVFTVATLRNLPAVHPLFKLIFPHTRYTLQINILARNRLISDDGAITMFSGIGGEALGRLLRRAAEALTYSSLCLPDDISERGLKDVPNYHYRDDGMKLWNIINKYVTGFLQYYYKSDDVVKNDKELQNWIQEIFTYGFLERKHTGIPSSFKTLAEFIKFVTMVIFIASAQHAAVNNGQFDFGGWMPNYPTALRKPPPKKKGLTTEETILKTLPDVGTTVNGMAVLSLLGKNSTDYYPLGEFPEDLFDEDVPLKLIEDLKNDLKQLTNAIEERNKSLKLSYEYLSPVNVDNSVAI